MDVNDKSAPSKVPKMIGVRTTGLEPLLKKWGADNFRVPWSVLARDGLKLALAKYAGKRYAHLVASDLSAEPKKSEVAA